MPGSYDQSSRRGEVHRCGGRIRRRLHAARALDDGVLRELRVPRVPQDFHLSDSVRPLARVVPLTSYTEHDRAAESTIVPNTADSRENGGRRGHGNQPPH